MPSKRTRARTFLGKFPWSKHSDDSDSVSSFSFEADKRNSIPSAKISLSFNDSNRSKSCNRIDDERRSKSSLDIRDGEPESNGLRATESPPISRRKKFWKTLKKSTRRLRSRSSDKIPKSKSHDAEMAEGSHDLSGTSDSPSAPKSHSFHGGHDFDSLCDASDPRSPSDRDMDRSSFAESGNAGTGEPRKEGKESEGDSGIAVGERSEASTLRQRQNALRAHPFFVMEVVLREGRDLVVRDACGTSDPYVKFKIGGKQYYKSRTVFKNLNPKWEEKLVLPIEDPFLPVTLQVYDYDRGLNDDFMGKAEIDPSTFELNSPTEIKLMLSEDKKKKKDAYMGYLILQCTLLPKTQDEKEQYFKRISKAGEAKKNKTQLWSSVVTICLVEGKKLIPMDDNGLSDPYVKFRLGNERYKSKYKAKTLNPTWLEQFDLHMFDDQTSHLEISVWDHDIGGKDDIMGRGSIDLCQYDQEVTHRINLELDDGAGTIHFMLSITGTAGNENVSDLATYNLTARDRQDVVRKYGVVRSFNNLKDIGWLQVKVIKAQGLAAADLGGKSDPFCVLELVNDRLQTHTEYKTLFPEWGKVFTLNVKDIHSILEVTVYDEDRDKKSEFLGKVAIPLLRIKRGECRWYGLKDKKLGLRAKGAILLELDFIYNHFKAAIRTFNPREDKYMQPDPKFKLAVMKRNIDRVSKLAQAGVEAGKFLQSCFDWESKARSGTAFAVFLIIVWNFELYMLPISLLIIFLKNLLVVHIVGNLMKERDEDEYVDDDEEDEEDEKTEKTSGGFRQKISAIQDACLKVQVVMDDLACLGERIQNTFNWTVPWLSWLAMTLLTIGTVVLFYIPVRYLIMAWGINKFTKKLRSPNAIPNNELLDYLSRVPSDKELSAYRELRPDSNIGTMKKKRA